MTRVYERRFDHDEARQLYLQNVEIAAIARRMRVSNSRIRQVLFPSEGAKALQRSLDWQSSGTCPDCGAQATRNGPHQNRCRPCANKHAQTSVGEQNLLCTGCQRWLPDDSFPHNKSLPHRRGRHRYCTTCGNQNRRDYRRRHPEQEAATRRAYLARKREAEKAPE